MRVRISEDFRASYKLLKKRHKSLEEDFERLLASLLENPMQGVELTGGVRTQKVTQKARKSQKDYGTINLQQSQKKCAATPHP